MLLLQQFMDVLREVGLPGFGYVRRRILPYAAAPNEDRRLHRAFGLVRLGLHVVNGVTGPYVGVEAKNGHVLHRLEQWCHLPAGAHASVVRKQSCWLNDYSSRFLDANK